MAGIGQERTGIGQHPQDVAEDGQVGNAGHLVNHALFRIVEPPGSALLDLAAGFRALESADNGTDHGVIVRRPGVENRLRQDMEFVKMVQESDEAFAAVAFGDAVKTRIRP